MTTRQNQSFMDWLSSTIPDTPEMRAIAQEETERYNLVSALREAREGAGHTQQSFALELGVKQALISKWEHINTNHTFHTLQKWIQSTKANLIMGLEVKGKWVPISARAEKVIVLPQKMETLLEGIASELGVSLQDLVLGALQQHILQNRPVDLEPVLESTAPTAKPKERKPRAKRVPSSAAATASGD
jgi:transcriptional regulator with XRE-family HTH domain